jgi:cyanate lyase
MRGYINPDATWRIAKLIRNRLHEISMSPNELAETLDIREVKVRSLLSAKHYFPLDLARATCKTLDLDGRDLVALILSQDFPPDAVEFVFEVIRKKASVRRKKRR